ncbi:MAG: hypothetical protein KIT09_18855 [Bryobacteraceae bacterium]|nr:hypothetical protein [Bryobacteraceae bacterium]
MRAALMLMPLLLAPDASNDPRLEPILARLAEEAEAFANAATRIVGQESLQQKALVTRRRFRLRVGQDALKPPPPQYRQREILSEYGFSVFREAPNSLHELRKVVAVDGMPVAGSARARETLTLGAVSDDDRLKKRMLREFQKHGLTDAAIDFGPLILLFRQRELSNYRFEIAGEGNLGADPAIIVGYQQAAGPALLTIFEGNRAARAPLAGELWVRGGDYLPLRIVLRSSPGENEKNVVRHLAEVDYFRSGYGVLLPASVRYRRLAGDDLVVENVCRYSNYSMFSVDAEIKFEPEPVAEPH